MRSADVLVGWTAGVLARVVRAMNGGEDAAGPADEDVGVPFLPA